ncbi:MAG: hypothetical protein KGI57_07415 [Hyphomicrobiales bacterium]|nr:hypothetical protein [Hyphomicrobiales bacterium]MDE2017516.1 hypothetical protein [Hyphomicrobiales bacterium]
MKFVAALLAGVAAVAPASPLLTRKPPPAAPATPAPETTDRIPAPRVSLGSLLADGYAIKSSYPMPREDQKVVWPDDEPTALTMIVLQKGASLATCVVETAGMIDLTARDLADATACRRR